MEKCLLKHTKVQLICQENNQIAPCFHYCNSGSVELRIPLRIESHFIISHYGDYSNFCLVCDRLNKARVQLSEKIIYETFI